MIKSVVAIMSLFALLLAAGCGKVSPQVGVSAPDDLAQLFQSWVHSYEEEQETSAECVQLFRPSEYKEFAPSRFRMRYVFNEDGTCEWLFLHPADAHYMKQGTWEAAPGDSKVVLIYDTDGTIDESVSFRIVEIEEELLRIEVGLITSR